MEYATEYYYTDLFIALINNNARGHPVLTALLYAFCPMAAKWWLNGADPVVPYDVVWEAVSDFTTELTLKDALVKRGVPDLIGHVKKYAEQVTKFRDHHRYNNPASELSQEFKGGSIEVTARTGYQDAFDKHFGGDWRNVLRFARTWLFTTQDWRGGVEIEAGKGYTIQKVTLLLNVPRLNKGSIKWPAWCWRIKDGYALRIVLGMMTDDSKQDQLRFALAASSQSYLVKETVNGKVDEKIIPWEVTPHLYSLDRQSGSVKPARLDDTKKLVLTIPSLALVAKKGACPPLGVLSQQGNCEHCGFQALCFTKDKDLTSIVYASMGDDEGIFDGRIV
ncbi:MAG TPA: hypothetical protein VF352_00475 [Anaerolineales bacterium]